MNQNLPKVLHLLLSTWALIIYLMSPLLLSIFSERAYSGWDIIIKSDNAEPRFFIFPIFCIVNMCATQANQYIRSILSFVMTLSLFVILLTFLGDRYSEFAEIGFGLIMPILLSIAMLFINIFTESSKKKDKQAGNKPSLFKKLIYKKLARGYNNEQLSEILTNAATQKIEFVEACAQELHRRKAAEQQVLMNRKQAKEQQPINASSIKNNKFTLYMVAAVLIIVVVTTTFIYLKEASVLLRSAELSLWLPGDTFFQSSTIYPGGRLTWAAAFMTQFFSRPLLGIAFMAICWLIISVMCIVVFRLRKSWTLLAALPPLALATCLTQNGYWIYYMKLQGHLWVPTLAVLISLAVVLPTLWSIGRNRWFRLGWITLVGVFAYPLLGMWSFLALGLLAHRSLNFKFKGGEGKTIALNLLPAFAALVLALVMPRLWYQWSFPQVQLKQLYLAAMPCFQYGKSNMMEFHYAYYALAFSFLPMVVARWMSNLKQWLLLPVCASLIVVYGWLLNNRWYKDVNFHKEIVMLNQTEEQNWEGVLQTMMEVSDDEEQVPPTRLMVMMKNLALFRLGRAGDEMFRYPEGSTQYCICGKQLETEEDSLVHKGEPDIKHVAIPVRITQTGGKMLYYNYGKEQFAYRWCMEDGVEFGWNVNVLKYMAKASLVTEDWHVAQKYLNMLKRTRYHRQWAEHYAQFVGHPELLREDPEMKPIMLMAQFPDRLDGDMTMVEMYLLKTFSTGTGADPYYQEMTLICSLIMKDIDLFWPRFQRYVSMHQNEPNFRVPIHYQEAAYLYSMLEPQRESQMWPGITNEEAAKRIPFDENVKKRYADFMKFNEKCGSMNEEQKAEAFAPQFGDTFYYFYFLVRGQKTN